MCGHATGCGNKWTECPKCHAVLRPWCEAFALPGARCTHHTGMAQHPDCPPGPPPNPIKERTDALLRGLPQDERDYVLQVENAPLRVVQERLAAIQAVKATQSNDPDALGSAVATGQVVARTRLLEAQASHQRLLVKEAMRQDRRAEAQSGPGRTMTIQIVDFNDEDKSERITDLGDSVASVPAPEATVPGRQKS